MLDVASSPIELAKAYMEAQTSASVQESQKRKFRALSHGVEVENSSSKVFPKIATDSPVCWPGSVVRNYPNYLTPQSNKGRTLPPTSSRTTYIGSVFPRSNKVYTTFLWLYFILCVISACLMSFTVTLQLERNIEISYSRAIHLPFIYYLFTVHRIPWCL